ncbi:MAG: restriction endonuclease subunit S [Streptococcus lutetiensis]|nr:restriction endonuclease subunit S [Streptococcus lutetiensis]MDU2564317.1 restriction endonuclease subunit S [Streptococcus lutetiensis]
MKTNSVPKIRFKGFTDDWEQRKFGEMFARRMERNNGEFDNTKWISVARMYYQTPDKVTSNNIDTRTYVMRKGDIAFEGHSNSEFKYGRFVANDIGDGVISELFPIYKHIDKYDLNYWKYAIQLESLMQSKLVKCIEISYTSSNKLDKDSFLKEKIPVASLAEQQKIGEYFSNLDHLITLHQRKCEQTKELKKFMLQKMFPKKGEKNPEIRFPGFTDDWEQRKLGELLNETRNKTTVEDEDTLLSCAIDGMFLNSELFSHFRGSSNIGYLKVKKNDLILSAQNLHLGNCNVNLRFEHGIISPAYKVYELIECNPLFMQAWVKQDKTKDFFLKASTEGASVCRKNIIWEELYKQKLPVPKVIEQQKIGEYFSNLDHLITLHQRKCEQLKELKKFMLQNMFPKKG